MKTFIAMAAQGDVLFIRVDSIPDSACRVDTEGRAIEAAHSETGHSHAFAAGSDVWLYSTPDQLVGYLDVKRPSKLVHQRAWDTHEEVLFDVGTYEIRRQREWVPEGWRRVVD